ncbi:reverse transcriptase [Plakobranchus ocellatus]|uniref:Reverse transcriptase n=1 Tax=Plakobranchus ocellatus TaxID=259542 RepID=A0AAV3XW02_9GAST|nr:reverse transcriptase [Plakobranchus ocellatus]
MEVILRVRERGASPADFGGECFMPPLKAFMDDTTILCSKNNDTRRMLVRLDALMKWSRMFQAEEVSKPDHKKNASIRDQHLNCGIYKSQKKRFTRIWLGVQSGLRDVLPQSATKTPTEVNRRRVQLRKSETNDNVRRFRRPNNDIHSATTRN